MKWKTSARARKKSLEKYPNLNCSLFPQILNDSSCWVLLTRLVRKEISAKRARGIKEKKEEAAENEEREEVALVQSAEPFILIP